MVSICDRNPIDSSRSPAAREAGAGAGEGDPYVAITKHVRNGTIYRDAHLLVPHSGSAHPDVGAATWKSATWCVQYPFGCAPLPALAGV